MSAVVLLSPEADSPQWTGHLQRNLPGEAPVSTLRYQVIRVWQVPVEQLLAGGVGTLALAPVSDVSEGEVRGVIRRMQERLSGPKAPRRAADVWAATYVLLGLRYSDAMAQALFEEVLGMEQSATYRAIVRKGLEQGRLEGREEGRAEGARRLLLLIGEAQLGPPDAATLRALQRMEDVEQIEELAVRLRNAASWQELLPSPARRRSQRRKTRP